MIEQISIVVPGTPLAKARPRFGNGRVYTPTATVVHETQIKWLAKRAMVGRKIMTGPIRMQVIAFFKAKGKTGHHTARPDWDNIGKLVSDALNEIVYEDDSQIAECKVYKAYGEEALTQILVSPMGGDICHKYQDTGSTNGPTKE